MSVPSENPWGPSPGATVNRWTEDETRRLMVLVHEDKDDPEIAKDLGRTSASIRNKRCRLGLVTRQLPARGVRAMSDRALISEVRRRGYRVAKDKCAGPTTPAIFTL